MLGLDALVAEFGVATLAALAVAAFVTSCIHGAVGVAGGLLMTAAVALLIGVRASVPVMSIALILSHGARTLMNLSDIDLRAFAWIMLPALPFILVSSAIYVALPLNALAAVLAALIFLSIPVRRWAERRKVRAGHRALAAAGAGYGFSAGASIGSAMLLSPFLLGYGLTKEAFVATMAIISLSTNVVRIGAFSVADIVTSQYALLGFLVGLIMIPGNWVGRTILRRMTTRMHAHLVDGFAVLGGLNFLYLALTI